MAALVETMMYVREKPWHGLGTRVEEAPSSKEAIELAGLDWKVNACPIYDHRGILIPGYQANTRDKDDKVLGIVGDQYQIVQNREAFDFTDALLGEGMKYETAGSLKGGKQIWLLGKMPEIKLAGDQVEPYLCFSNTHDGSGAIKVCMTPTRVVCNNTLSFALSHAKRSWSTIHKGDIKTRLDAARDTLGLMEIYLKRLEEEADRLANEPLSSGELIVAFDQILLKKAKDKMTQREKKAVDNQRDAIYACMFAPDLAQFIGTKWGFLNAVADYVSHGEPMRKTANWQENRFANIIEGRTLLDRAYAAVAK